mgnify:CR=1 FL=1
MERQTQTLLLSREERAALDTAILDMCAFNAEPERAKPPVSSSCEHPDNVGGFVWPRCTGLDDSRSTRTDPLKSA